MTEQTHTEAGELLALADRIEKTFNRVGLGEVFSFEQEDAAKAVAFLRLAATRPATSEAVAWQKRWKNEAWVNIHDTSDEHLYSLDQEGWETRALYTAPPPSPDPVAVKALEAIVKCYTPKFGGKVYGLTNDIPLHRPYEIASTAVAQIRSEKK